MPGEPAEHCAKADAEQMHLLDLVRVFGARSQFRQRLVQQQPFGKSAAEESLIAHDALLDSVAKFFNVSSSA